MVHILLVEDSPTDRKLLRYLLDAQMNGGVEFHEATTLRQAIQYLDRSKYDCVILDLQLPDSVGYETFTKIYAQHPDVPIVIMTNNQDRNLAIEMIRKGAADYVLKNLDNEDEIFRRVAFAMEKHKHTVRASPEGAASYNRLTKAKTSLTQAAETDATPSTIRNVTIEATSAIADISHKIFTQLQQMSYRVEQISLKQQSMGKTVDTLETEILHGHPDRPSMRSQMDLLDHRIVCVEKNVEQAEEVVTKVTTTKIDTKGRVTVAFLGTLGLVIAALLGGLFTYLAATHKSNQRVTLPASGLSSGQKVTLPVPPSSSSPSPSNRGLK